MRSLLLVWLSFSLWAQSQTPSWFLGDPYKGIWIVDYQKTTQNQVIINLESDPSQAQIFINKVPQEKTPIKNLVRPQGPLEIRLELAGYYPTTLLLNAQEPGIYNLKAKLEIALATLTLLNYTPDVQVFINDEKLPSANKISVPPGRLKIRLRRFGYQDIISRHQLAPLEEMNLTLEWKEAEFELSSSGLGRRLINPNLPGTLGSLLWAFQVSAPGQAYLSIYAPEAEEPLAVVKSERFNDWDQVLIWKPPPNLAVGAYQAKLYAQGQDGREFSFTEPFQIDKSLRFSPFPSWFEASLLPPETLYFLTELGTNWGNFSQYSFSADIRFPIFDWETQLKLSSQFSLSLTAFYLGIRILGPPLIKTEWLTWFWGLEVGQNFQNGQLQGLLAGQANGIGLLTGLLWWSPVGAYVNLNARGGSLLEQPTFYLLPNLKLGWASERFHWGAGANYLFNLADRWEFFTWLMILPFEANLVLGVNAQLIGLNLNQWQPSLAITLGIAP